MVGKTKHKKLLNKESAEPHIEEISDAEEKNLIDRCTM